MSHGMDVFATLESEVRTYSRAFPTVFSRAVDYHLYDEAGREYIDFFSGAGTLNYGHNNPVIKSRLIEYLKADGITHSLDMATTAKRELLDRFQRVILGPRGLDYKVQFVGPTGANAVEAALKLARKVTRRPTVVHFTDSYHGVTLGALSVTGNASKRMGAGIPLPFTVAMPFDGYFGPHVDTIEILEAYLEDPSSGLDKPAAVIVETVQAEGGIHVAGFSWLQRLAALLRRHGVLLIVDDIQVGCGRTGKFFSFEEAGIVPDVVTLSKSISGYGLPMALVLLRPELDVWSPGEHNGTFRGHNLAFVAGAEALSYWEDNSFSGEIFRKSGRVRARLDQIAAGVPPGEASVRGRGLIQGIEFRRKDLANDVAQRAFQRGLVIEPAGPRDEVLKLLPPLIIDDEGLERGLRIIEECLEEAIARSPERAKLAGV